MLRNRLFRSYIDSYFTVYITSVVVLFAHASNEVQYLDLGREQNYENSTKEVIYCHFN